MAIFSIDFLCMKQFPVWFCTLKFYLVMTWQHLELSFHVVAVLVFFFHYLYNKPSQSNSIKSFFPFLVQLATEIVD